MPRLVSDGEDDLSYGVVAAPSGPRSVAVRFKSRLSLGFYGDFDCGPVGPSIFKCWDSKRSLFISPGFGYPDPSGRLGLGSDF